MKTKKICNETKFSINASFIFEVFFLDWLTVFEEFTKVMTCNIMNGIKHILFDGRWNRQAGFVSNTSNSLSTSVIYHSSTYVRVVCQACMNSQFMTMNSQSMTMNSLWLYIWVIVDHSSNLFVYVELFCIRRRVQHVHSQWFVKSFWY